MIHFANPLHNTFLVRRDDPRNTCALRRYDGETWQEALARQSYPGCKVTDDAVTRWELGSEWEAMIRERVAKERARIVAALRAGPQIDPQWHAIADALERGEL